MIFRSNIPIPLQYSKTRLGLWTEEVFSEVWCQLRLDWKESLLSLYLSELDWVEMLTKYQFFIPARCEGCSPVSGPLSLSISLYSPSALLTIHQPSGSGIQFLGLSWDLNFTTLGGRPCPALNINLQNENNFNNPLTFDDVKIESS